jgi:hypothetical protein
MNLKDLTKEIPYKWRTGPGGKQLAYIDSRDVQDLLDEVVGAENWQSDFKLIDNKLFGGIGVYCNVAKTGEYYQWIWKWDCGTESNIDEEKGQVSDALKRAGVQWGIGRFLYDIKDGKPKEQPKKPTSDNFSSDSFLLTLQVLVDAWNKRHKTSQAQVLKVEDTNVL